MRVLVTGATGFVGSAVAKQAVKNGYSVRCLVRSSSPLDNLKDLDVETVHGDLTDADAVARAMDGIEVVFHVAADYRLFVRDPNQMYAANVGGARHVVLAALKAGVERVVYTSSVCTLRLDPAGNPVDETSKATLADMIGHYKRSKFLAEREVDRLVREHCAPVVTVSPSTPIGPRDIKPTPTGAIIVDTLQGKMPAYVDTGLNVVHVDDVAKGHLLALERGRVGERYILGGDDMMLCEILSEICRLGDLRPPTWRLSPNMLMPLAYVCETVARLRRQNECRINRDGLRMAKKKMFFSSRKAQDELGYTPGPAHKALVDAAQWFQKNGYCPLS
ncbi:hopanoid-associated sugar epimerase [Desulfovibrio inopinatus]|uniref:hopanoid-associated sugar epimerase n=1 Tax=Desulfovibrio inopinatus TaxID=102109 RepID=UPI0003F8B942|nr:hopanoid-associated sugar epimerase [Desulfovibrio inopinatus]